MMANKPTLKMDSVSMARDFKNQIKIMAQEVTEQFLKEFSKRSKSPNDFDKEDIAMLENFIESKVTFYVNAILDSYGTGSKIDTSNEFLNEYQSSSLWNPLRNSLTVVGRPQGSYTDIFGNEAYSSGRMAGMNLEAAKKYSPRNPSFAIQRAEDWIMSNTTTVTKIINRNISKFFKNTGKYFTFS